MSSHDRTQAGSHAKRWATALEALAHVEPWLAFRYVVAQAYNAHKPQGATQQADRARCARLAAVMVQHLGGNLYAPIPPEGTTGPAWAAFVQAVGAMGEAHQQALMWAVWTAQWGAVSKPAPEHRGKLNTMRALALTLHDMHHQQQANDRGWDAKTGWPKRRGRPGS